MGPDRTLPEASFLGVWVGACLRWPVGEWRADGVCLVCPCLLWQGVKVPSVTTLHDLKIDRTLKIIIIQ